MYRAKLFASQGVLNNTLKAIMESLYEKSKWEKDIRKGLQIIKTSRFETKTKRKGS